MGLLATYTSGRLGLTSALDPAVVGMARTDSFC